MKNKKLIAAVVALVVVIALLLGLYFVTRPDTQAGNKSFTVEVVHGDGTAKEFEYKTDEEYVGAVLIEDGLIQGEEYVGAVLIEDGLIQGEEGPWGMYIAVVDGERAVYEENSAYWALYVGEEYATQSVELTPIEDGATYKLVHTPA